MRLTLAQLEAFQRIAQLGSFQAAARSLALSQPALSIRLKTLEEIIGQRLVERGRRRVRLTPAGHDLLQHANTMLDLATRISGEERHIDPLEVGLRLGAPDSFATVCMPKMLELIERDYPELSVALTIENSAVLNRLLTEGELDIAFISEPQVGLQFQMELLGRQDLAWFASPRLDLPRRAIRPTDLVHHHVLTNADPSRLLRLVRDWFGQEDLTPPRISTCNNLTIIALLTMKAAGVSILPTTIVRAEVRSGALKRLVCDPPIEPQRLFAVYRGPQMFRSVPLVLEAARTVMRRTRFLID